MPSGHFGMAIQIRKRMKMDPEASWCGVRTYNYNNYQILDSLNENAFTKMRVSK